LTYRKATIKQVAKASGVSTQTISRVLNERPDVAPETRLRILQVIHEMGYTPSALARGMIRQRSFTIGVMFSKLSLNGGSITLDAIFAEADRLGYTLLLKELPNPDSDGSERLLRSLIDYHVDGIIWAVPKTGNHPQLTQMDFPVPVVFVNTSSGSAQTVVSLDYFKSGYLATRHLIDQGYQNIAHISGPSEWWSARECKRGWEKSLRDAHRAVPAQAYAHGDWSPMTGCQAASRLFSQYPEVDAIFVANSQMALGILYEASRRRRKIPAELGIVALDDTSEADFFCPPLTIVAQDYAMLGRTAMQKLAWLIETDNKTQSISPTQSIIEPILLVRESTIARDLKNSKIRSRITSPVYH
jgi:DNA-binding LacI/PurR family transcriptional regulator